MFCAEQISAIMNLFLGNDLIVCQPNGYGMSIIIKAVLPNIKMETKNVQNFYPHVVFTVVVNRQANMAIEQFSEVTQQFINL